MWFACVVGVCGIHRFYLGRNLSGFVWLITFGLLGIGQFIDIFLIPGMTDDRNLINRALSEELKNDAIRQATLIMAGTQATIAGSSPKNVHDTQQQILSLLLKNEIGMSLGQLCASTELGLDALKLELNKMTEQGLIYEFKKEGTAHVMYRIG